MISFDECYIAIAKNIKKIRKENDLTQREMAEKLSLETSYYARLERGTEQNRKFTLEQIITICSLFNIEPKDIITVLPKTDNSEIINVEALRRDIIDQVNKLSAKELKNMAEGIRINMKMKGDN